MTEHETARLSFTLPRPTDAHVHLRDGQLAQLATMAVTRLAGHAVVMPNLIPPVTTIEQLLAYADRLAPWVLDPGLCRLHLTLYLTPETTPAMILEALPFREQVAGVKWYPAGATTHSEAGVRDMRHLYPVLEVMEREGIPLLVHGEVVDAEIDIFDREAVFLDRVLTPVRLDFPGLKIVVEHISTREAVAWVRGVSGPTAATITPHHLRYTRNDLLVGGVRPHLYCLPILKAEAHRTALRGAMLSGDPRFFAGTDSAPHWRHLKEASCGCAGVYHGEAWLAHYASIYDRSADLSDPLHQEGFTRFLVDHSLMFYGWERPRGRVRLTRRPQSIPLWVGHDEAMVVPMGAGETLDWTAEVCRD